MPTAEWASGCRCRRRTCGRDSGAGQQFAHLTFGFGDRDGDVVWGAGRQQVGDCGPYRRDHVVGGRGDEHGGTGPAQAPFAGDHVPVHGDHAGEPAHDEGEHHRGQDTVAPIGRRAGQLRRSGVLIRDSSDPDSDPAPGDTMSRQANRNQSGDRRSTRWDGSEEPHPRLAGISPRRSCGCGPVPESADFALVLPSGRGGRPSVRSRGCPAGWTLFVPPMIIGRPGGRNAATGVSADAGPLRRPQRFGRQLTINLRVGSGLAS